MTRPKLSLLVPTYNYARFIGRTMQSLLDQDYRDFEVIISDDASSDDTEAVVRSLVGNDPRFVFHRHPANLGMVANWNWCLAQARGDYVQYLFGDDFLISPDALRTLVGALDAQPGAALAASARRMADEHDVLGRRMDDLGRAGLHDGVAVIWQCLGHGENRVGEPSVVMFRRALASRGFDAQYRQLVDLEMWLHLCEQGDLVFIDTPLCAFRQHGEQQSAVNARNQSARLELYALFCRYLPATALAQASPARQLAYRTGMYRIMYQLRKGGLADPAAAAAYRTLAERLPQPWRSLAAAHYRLQRIQSNIRRSLDKRMAGH